MKMSEQRRNSYYLESALSYQFQNGMEEEEEAANDNSSYDDNNDKYWSNDDSIIASKNMEMSYGPAPHSKSGVGGYHDSHVAADMGNYNTNCNNYVSSSSISSPASPASPSSPTRQQQQQHYSSTPSTPSTPTSPQSSSSSSIGVNLRVTGQCSQGGRKYMEDYFSVAYQQSENTKDLEYAFVGIYDGHGGADAAIFAKEHLMMAIINQKLFWSDSDQDVLRAIREGYIATHYAMWREQDKWPKTARGLLSTAGTTATIAFIRREKLYIGHVGDSGIVLGYQNENENFWRAKPLTTDHKPESTDERNRIMRAGGKVVVKSGVPRVVWNRPRLAGHRGPVRRSTPIDEIPFLAVARSLGDLWSYNSELNEFVVSPDPDVKVIKINPKTFRCLIFGTDGLWNVITPQEAVDCVYEKELINEKLHEMRGDLSQDGTNPQWTNPSKGLVKRALKTWSSKKMRADNTSVVTVILYPPGRNVADSTPSSLHNQSYGLEYSQLNAEIPAYDDSTSYAELANKYLPPEEYRNFKYDDLESEEVLVDPLESQYSPYATHNYGAYEPVMLAASGHDYYEPLPQRHPAEHIVNGATDEESDVDDQYDDYNDVDEYVDERIVHTNTHASSMDNFAIDEYPQQYRPQPQQHYRSVPPQPLQQSSQLHSKLMEQESLDYMDSFAESYTDSLLNGGHAEDTLMDANSNHPAYQIGDSRSSDTRSSSNSGSSSSGSSGYHNAIFQHNLAHQQQLLMEHQQYQEQCMSQEEGYSLTKLETRGEQQMRNKGLRSLGGECNDEIAAVSSDAGTKEVQTFKIFQQKVVTEEEAEATDEPLSKVSEAVGPCEEQNNISPSRESLWETRYPALQRYMQSYATPAKLELNSLLQQEMEEEQQVAIERLELQRHADLQAQQAQQPLADQEFQELEETLSADYLVEEDATMALDTSGNYIEESTVSELTEEDTTIQINEISSSIESPAAFEEVLEMEVEPVDAAALVQQDEQQMSSSSNSSSSSGSSFAEESSSSSSNSSSVACSSRFGSSSSVGGGASSSKPQQIVLIEKIEILHKNPECDTLEPLISISNSSPTLPSHITNNHSHLPPASQRLRLSRAKNSYPSISAKQPTKALINPSPSKRTHYPNVPNENQRLSLSCSSAASTSSSSSSSSCSRTQRRCEARLSYEALQQQQQRCSEKRQLRSMAPPLVIDYAKRTLRSRNSLSKDMKAKSTLNLNRRSMPISSQFLRTTAATLLASNSAAVQQQQQQQHQQTQKLLRSKSTVCPLQLSMTGPKSAHSAHAINLRSRQVLPQTPPPPQHPPAQQLPLQQPALDLMGTRAGATLANSVSFNQLQQRRERRSLRNLSVTKSSTSCRHNSRERSVIFSKATRLQATAANLAAPPPSPKLIYACTRARSMLTPKATVSNIPLEFHGKRSTLRSSTTTSAINVSATASSSSSSSSTSLQKRSRVQKR